MGGGEVEGMGMSVGRGRGQHGQVYEAEDGRWMEGGGSVGTHVGRGFRF